MMSAAKRTMTTCLRRGVMNTNVTLQQKQLVRGVATRAELRARGNRRQNEYRERGSAPQQPAAVLVREEAVYGVEPVRSALLCQRRERYCTLYVQEGLVDVKEQVDRVFESRKRAREKQKRQASALSNDDVTTRVWETDGGSDEDKDSVELVDKFTTSARAVRRGEGRRKRQGNAGSELSDIVRIAVGVHDAELEERPEARGSGRDDGYGDEYARFGTFDTRTRMEDMNVPVPLGVTLVLAERSKHFLNQLCGNRPHQGVVLDCSPLEPTPIDVSAMSSSTSSSSTSNSGENNSKSSSSSSSSGSTDMRSQLFLALDEVQDPQNLGALLRSAHFLGVDGVIVCGKNSAPLSAAVAKASAGALDHIHSRLFSVSSMPRFLNRCAEAGWDVVGTDTSAETVEDVRDFRAETKTILVLGNEGAGLRTLVSKACSRHVMITPRQPHSLRGGGTYATTVDSLNVSTAGAILMHMLRL